MEQTEQFLSWTETFYETVDFISYVGERSARIAEIRKTQGRFGLHSLARELTDKFESMNAGREWDGEFLEEIWEFLETELGVKM